MCGCKMWMWEADTVWAPDAELQARGAGRSDDLYASDNPNPDREVVLAGVAPARGHACGRAFVAAQMRHPWHLHHERHELSRQGAVERISSFVVACMTRTSRRGVVAWKRIYTCTKAGILLHREWFCEHGMGSRPSPSILPSLWAVNTCMRTYVSMGRYQYHIHAVGLCDRFLASHEVRLLSPSLLIRWS
jgi:hypothetical protein